MTAPGDVYERELKALLTGDRKAVARMVKTCNAWETAAYNLMHRSDFPSFRIGKRLLVKRDKLTAWLDAQGKTTHGYQPPYLFPDSGC